MATQQKQIRRKTVLTRLEANLKGGHIHINTRSMARIANPDDKLTMEDAIHLQKERMQKEIEALKKGLQGSDR